MEQDPFYYDLHENSKNKAVAFLMRALLKGKASLGSSVKELEDDDDVNVYLAHLLFAVATPQYQHLTERYLSPYCSDVDRMAGEADETYIKYFIYKVNADHLLVHLGLFKDLGEEAPRIHALSEVHDEKFSTGRATQYYGQAASFNRRVYRRPTAVGTVLAKLSDRFHLYKEMLRATRAAFFHFTSTLSDEQFARFVADLERLERDANLRVKQDEFLDTYLRWLKERTEETRAEVAKLADELETLDPAFKFEWRRL